MSRKGVLPCCNRALAILSLFMAPLSVLPLRSLFKDFTAASACPFDLGKYADDNLNLTPQDSSLSFISRDDRFCPPSAEISSAIPHL